MEVYKAMGMAPISMEWTIAIGVWFFFIFDIYQIHNIACMMYNNRQLASYSTKENKRIISYMIS
jgi:hypothetical protein